MAYGLKYYIEYTDIQGSDTRIELLPKDYTGAVTELKAGGDPLNIEMGGLESKFDATRSSGATIQISTNDSLPLDDLYTIDPTGVMVKCYKGASNILFWCGFLNAEVFGSSYRGGPSYDVALYANDGLAVFDRKLFALNGILTAWEIIVDSLTVVPLELSGINVCMDIWENDMDRLTSPLHQLYVNCDNFYDEKGIAMNWREVLESILQPLGAIGFQEGGYLYIVENRLFKEASISRKKYNLNGDYLTTDTVDFSIDFLNTGLKWLGSSQTRDIKPGFNRQTIKCSVYPYENVFVNGDITDLSKWNGELFWRDYTREQKEFVLVAGTVDIDGWTADPEVGAYKSITDKGDVIASIALPNLSASVRRAMFYNDLGTIFPALSTTQGIAVAFEIRVNNKSSADVASLKIPMRLSINGSGSLIVGDLDEPTTNTAVQPSIAVSTPLYKFTQDTWQTITLYSIPGMPSGPLLLEFFSDIKAYSDEEGTSEVAFDDVQIKGFTVSSVEFEIESITNPGEGTTYNVYIPQGEVSDSDIEYEGIVNDDFSKKASDITLTNSDLSGKHILSKAAFLRDNREFTTGWEFGNSGIFTTLQEHLISNIINNYSESAVMLSGTLDIGALPLTASNEVDGVFTFTSILKDTVNLGTKKLRCINATYNDKMQEIDGEWEEIIEGNIETV